MARPDLITHNGYELCAVPQFLERAPTEHIARFRRDCIGQGSFIIWDPNDDADGFMVCCMSMAECRAEFMAHFDGFLSEPDTPAQ